MKNLTFAEAVKMRNVATKFSVVAGGSAVIDLSKCARVGDEILIGGLYTDSKSLIKALALNAAAGFAGVEITRSMDGTNYTVTKVYETAEELEAAQA